MKPLLLLLLAAILIGDVNAHKKVLLSDVNTITLKAGQYTTGRRNAPVPQLKCVGGAAAHQFTPRVAQCTKVGFDGLDYQWRCSAEMPTEYEFGKITVNCEGFNSPDDAYILHGSCGLEYDLEYTADLKRDMSAGRSKNDPMNYFGTGAVIVIILIVLYAMCTRRPDDDIPSATRRHYGDGGPGYPPGPDTPGYPPGSGYPGKPNYRQPTPPPSYDESFPENTARQRTTPNASRGPQTMGFGGLGGGQGQNQGPGFWTGAGLGGLGGYFLGRSQAQQTRRESPQERRSTSSSWFEDSGRSSPSSTRTDTHVSTGYGGTTRR